MLYFVKTEMIASEKQTRNLCPTIHPVRLENQTVAWLLLPVEKTANQARTQGTPICGIKFVAPWETGFSEFPG